MGSVNDSFISSLSKMDPDTAEAAAVPLFMVSLFPYGAFLYFLNRSENKCPKGVIVGFGSWFLTIFIQIVLFNLLKAYGFKGLGDSDSFHGTAESVHLITNLFTFLAFRRAVLSATDRNPEGENSRKLGGNATSFALMEGRWRV